MKIEKSKYGIFKGNEITAYKLTNDNGMYATFINLGGINTEIVVKDKNGKFVDVALQYKDIDALDENIGNLGAIVARNANRIANALANISGVEYKLVDNNNSNNLHSGPDLFHKKVLDAVTSEGNGEVSVEFSYKFKDMEQGFPGNMDFKIKYTLNNTNELKLRYEAISDKDTIFNPTFHGYFNLAGHDYGTIYSHKIKIHADNYTSVNEVLIPESVDKVRGTVFDFTNFKYMNDGIDDPCEQIKRGKGFDHNFALNDYDGTFKKAVEVVEDNTGIKMDVYTDLPGMQFYAGNALNPKCVGKSGKMYVKRGGFCLESQYFPNAINDGRFISPLLKAGVKKVTNTSYRFSIA